MKNIIRNSFFASSAGALVIATMLIASPSSADEKKFQTCMSDTLLKFGKSAVTGKLNEIVKQVDARNKCYSYLEKNDHSYEQVMKDLKMWEKVQKRAIRCNGCNI